MTETTPQHITSKYTHQPPVAPKRIVPDNYVISNKSELLHPGTVPLARWFEDGLSSLSAEAMSSPTESMALISTKDLVAIDSLLPDMAAAYPHPQDQQLYYSSSPRKKPRYLRSGAAKSRSPHGTSPHARSRGQAYGPEPLRLAPDRNSKEIPLDAQWTNIRRALVSPEVLERAGVRYEARLDYVAVLGRISREQIATYARKSAECRAARSGGFVSESKSSRRPRADSRDRREDHDDYGDEYVDDNEESVLWDESDSTDNDETTPEKGTSTTHILSARPERAKHLRPVRPCPSPFSKISMKIGCSSTPNRTKSSHIARRLSPTTVTATVAGGTTTGAGKTTIVDTAKSRTATTMAIDVFDTVTSVTAATDTEEAETTKATIAVSSAGTRALPRRHGGETLGAVGIGGAAAGPLGVLAEATAGM